MKLLCQNMMLIPESRMSQAFYFITMEHGNGLLNWFPQNFPKKFSVPKTFDYGFNHLWYPNYPCMVIHCKKTQKEQYGQLLFTKTLVIQDSVIQGSSRTLPPRLELNK